MILTWRRRQAQAYIETGLERVVYGTEGAIIVPKTPIPVVSRTARDVIQSITQSAVRSSTSASVEPGTKRIE
jgi:hypothetical protein